MKKFLVTVFCLASLAISRPAHALLFDLTSNHCSNQAGCGAPGTVFGTVDVAQIGANVQITVALNSPYVFANTGSVDNMAFKFNATGVVAGDISITPQAGLNLVAVQGTCPGATCLDGDGTGQFVFGIQCTNCGGGLSSPRVGSPLVFTIANATIAEVT